MNHINLKEKMNINTTRTHTTLWLWNKNQGHVLYRDFWSREEDELGDCFLNSKSKNYNLSDNAQKLLHATNASKILKGFEELKGLYLW